MLMGAFLMNNVNPYERMLEHSVFVGGGTGVIIQPQSAEYTYILTSKHEVDRVASINDIKINTADSKTIKPIAKYVHNTQDLAVLLVPKMQVTSNLYCLQEIKNTRSDQLVEILGFPNMRRKKGFGHQHRKFEGHISDVRKDNVFVVSVRDFPDRSQMLGVSGGGIFKVLENNDILLCGIEYEMEGHEFNGKVCCHGLLGIDEIINSHGLSKINYTTSLSPEIFSVAWFSKNLKVSIENLGVRYSSSLNIPLKIVGNFNVAVANSNAKKNIQDHFHVALKSFNDLINLNYSFNAGACIKDDLKDAVQKIWQAGNDIVEKKQVGININELVKSVDVVINGLDECQNSLSSQDDGVDSDNAKVLQDPNKKIKEVARSLFSVQTSFYTFKSYLRGNDIRLYNNGVLLISGAAGMGKSHLLGDIAQRYVDYNKPCVLLLGQSMSTKGDVWSQILALLGLTCSKFDLLRILNSYGEALGERIPFMVDAINEGRGYDLWPSQLAGFVEDFNDYPYVALIFSVRSTYRPLFLDNLNERIKAQIVEVRHNGFKGNEHLAIIKFFAYYGLTLPSSPLLKSEFSNPLFLKLLCKGLKELGHTSIPKGAHGITRIFDIFISGVENKLSKSKRFRYGERRLVKKSLQAISCYMIQHDFNDIPYEDAYNLVLNTIGKTKNKHAFLEEMISEGLLIKEIHYEDDYHGEVVHMAYERLLDHLKVDTLLSKIDKEDISKAFKNKGLLQKYLLDSRRYQGVVEAMAVQIPEKYTTELFELLPEKFLNDDCIISAFNNSLAWRSPKSINVKKINGYFVDYVKKSHLGSFEFFNAIYKVGADSSHPINAGFLHTYLMGYSLAERDGFWVEFLYLQDEINGSVYSVINWVLKFPSINISNVSAYLIGLLLSWVLPTTTKRLRNQATKALVLLFENRLNIALQILVSFEKCNDPYVYERILCAIYGAVLRSKDMACLGDLCGYLQANFFDRSKEIYPNFLARDFARNIVEYAIYKKALLLNDKLISTIRPPYNSKMPKKLPKNKETDALRYSNKKIQYKPYYSSSNDILMSMVTEYGRGTSSYGDFGRYVFESNLNAWRGIVDANLLSNYACKLIFDKYGYDAKKHGLFDESNPRSESRMSNEVERIGKKYQWISMYEVLARVADNYQMNDPANGWKKSKKMWCPGAWEPSVRDFDPSFIEYYNEDEKPLFNLPEVDFNDWAGSNEEWVKSSNNFPNPLDMITVIYEGEEWISLERHFSCEEPTPLGEDKYNIPRKKLWLQIRSYFLKKDQASKVIDGLKDKSFMGRWMPESPDQRSIFNREYYWSPAYKFFQQPYYITIGWQKLRIDDSEKSIGVVLPTAENHNWESVKEEKDGYNYLAPNVWLFNGLNMKFSDHAAIWLNQSDEMVCFDPSVYQSIGSQLLIKKAAFLDFLQSNNLAIIWTALGEKLISGLRTRAFNFRFELSALYYLDSTGEIIEHYLKCENKGN